MDIIMHSRAIFDFFLTEIVTGRCVFRASLIYIEQLIGNHVSNVCDGLVIKFRKYKFT